MSDYNNYEDSNEECKCMICNLTDEFKTMIQDGVEWELALRHILDVMSSEMVKSDEQISDAIEEAYVQGFTEGLSTGIDKSRRALDELADETDEDIADIYAIYGIEDESNEESEKVEDLTDEQFESIQSILRKSM